ncbi:hypothetical protein [Benzoatithermus flavus]|uniref:Uncharacterized protein n=1 Tax=Benzoatithermus flavus TaxID=3108223 RepID=A0ABU8XQ98_9PROT
MRHMTAVLLAATCAAGFGLPAMAGDAAKLPQNGKVKFQVSYVQWTGRDIQLDGKTSFGTFEFAGITRNVEGKPWFDRMTEHCTGQYYAGEKRSAATNGSCLYVDPDGDKVMINWTGGTVPYAGTKQVVGGTGKYAGITGQGTYTGTDLKTPAEGMDLWLTDVELDFQIKAPTQ